MQLQNRNSIVKLILVGIIIANSFTAAQETKVTFKKNNYLREGPAVYFKLTDILPSGEKVNVLEIKGKWSKVKLNNGVIGWLSNKSFEKKQNGLNISKLAKKWASKKVSKISLAGAIKGLLGKAGESNQGDFNRLLKLTHTGITGLQVNNFIKELNMHESENRDEVDWDDANLQLPEYEPDLEDQQIGFGIASRIAGRPMVFDENIRNYLYLIMYALLEESEFYDYEFNIFLVKDINPDGYSCPGGFIFITTGVFNICQDESELAAAIAHEIGHQILNHGKKELSKRKTQMKADDLFAEMENDVPGANDTISNDLEIMIANSYEKVVHYRTLEYEEEADKAAAILLANAGYDPFAIGRLTSRLAKIYIAERDIFSDDYLKPNDVKTRSEEIVSFLNENFEKEEPGAKMKNRFTNFYNMVVK